MTEKNLFPISIENEGDYIMFKLYEHKIEEGVWEEYVRPRMKEAEEVAKESGEGCPVGIELTEEEVKVRDLFEKTYRGFLCISTLLPIELGYTKNRETRFDDMYDFRAYEAGKCNSRREKPEVSKEAIVKLIKSGYLKYHGGGCSLMAKKRVYDQSWGIGPKGIKYCKERGFDKLIK